jgi:hypothetical protein
MPKNKIVILVTTLLLLTFVTNGQNKPDTTVTKNTAAQKKLYTDSTKKKFDPRVATFRSAVLPGWGQIYNKKYWKLALVYPALGITAGVFFYNLKTYKDLRKSFILKTDTIPSNDIQIPELYRNLSAESLRSYRNEFRQNIDYSVLVFLIFWGLNVVDATVDAHLKAFDVSDDISMKIKPGYNSGTNKTGVAIVFSLRDKHNTQLFLP